MRVLTVLGARPQFIKASVVSAALARESIPERIVHSGQHFDPNMSSVFFQELGIPNPSVHLGISGGRHGEMTGRMLIALEEVLIAEAPTHVVVYGDTNTTLAGALAAAKLNIPIVHVEAGLRSLNRRMPEEVNRVATDHLSTWLFAPTAQAMRHLDKEGLAGPRTIQVGDVMYDAAIEHGRRAESRVSALWDELGLEGKDYVLCTVHRAENTDCSLRLGCIADALSSVAIETPVIWPLHPRTRRALASAGLLESVEGRVVLIEPVGYLDMVLLERRAAVIATDSGGVQKEAFFHGVPCVTIRDQTEWVELVDLGWNRLVSPIDAADVRRTILSAMGTRGRHAFPYGDGRASERIVTALSGSVS